MFMDKGLESIFISPNMFGALFTITLVWLLVLYFLLIMNSKFLGGLSLHLNHLIA